MLSLVRASLHEVPRHDDSPVPVEHDAFHGVGLREGLALEHGNALFERSHGEVGQVWEEKDIDIF